MDGIYELKYSWEVVNIKGYRAAMIDDKEIASDSGNLEEELDLDASELLLAQ